MRGGARASKPVRRRSRWRGPDLRIVSIGILMLLGWVGVGLQLFAIQVVDAGEYRDRALGQRQREVVLAADRGAIFDRNGRQLAVTIKSWSVIANPHQVEDPVITARLVSAALNTDPEAIEEKLRRDSGFVFLARQLEEPEIEDLKALDLSGIFLEEEPKRAYPAGTLAAQVLGFVNIDGEGIEGLEAYYDDDLAGEPGYLVNEQDPLGRPIPQGEYQIQPAEPGSNLVLTLNLSIQFMAEQACANAIDITDAKACTIVVLDPSTGEVLAMAVVPTFDPSNRAGVDPETFQNRAVRYIYEPGSTQKLVTISAALEEGVVNSDTKFNVPYSIDVADQTFEEYGDSRPELTLSVKDIVTRSSNVGTILVQKKLGDEKLREYLDAYGYGQKTGVDYSGESGGAVAVDPSCGSCTASAAIGYSVSATPLQMAAVYATVANDGVWVQPHLVADIVDGEGVTHPIVPRTRQVISEATAVTMRYLLRNVVDEGTGKRAAVPGYSVGGKTGTSEKAAIGGGYTSDNIASFIGMAPISNPQLVVAVVIDTPINGNTGGAAAAPAFAEVMEKALHHLGVEPDAK